LGLHTFTPWAVHRGRDVVVPMLSDGTLVADLALDGVGLHQWESGDDTRIPTSLAAVALKRALVYVISTVFAPSCWKGLTD
jgi:hypothetical protein